MTINLSPENFLNVSARTNGFEPLLARCFREKASICLDIKDENIQVRLVPSCSKGDRATAKVENYISLQSTSNKGVGTSLLIPFLLDITKITLPHFHIISMVGYKRTIADFFARNLFYAASKRNCTTFEFTADYKSSARSEIAAEFRKRYLWVCRAMLSEPAFKAEDAVSKLIINAHFRIFSFENSLLEVGAVSLREALLQNQMALGATPLNESFMVARMKILEHLP